MNSRPFFLVINLQTIDGRDVDYRWSVDLWGLLIGRGWDIELDLVLDMKTAVKYETSMQEIFNFAQLLLCFI